MEYKAARACPFCGADSIVYNTRRISDGRVERHRECQVCGTRFVTIEQFVRFVKRGVEYGNQERD